ncbi:alcohol dehydrogenase transcription factor myb/SANT-like domain-containing protein [Phthorimaea operculella]|nr:alcohol dehydrogenase transcription factor myb/SANT-like domain-containing protein [Phthorimaea operculella]
MFNEKLDIKLIKTVKDNPVLYDPSDKKYMDFNAREVAWHKIGDALQKPAADCKIRWIHIRDVHRRIIRKCITQRGTKMKLYKYHNELAFMGFVVY